MAFTINVDIVSAEASIFSGRAERVVVPAAMGELCILPRHAPLLTHLRPGLVRVVLSEGQEEVFFVSSGFLEVQPHLVTVLADTLVRGKELDEAAARAAQERAEQAAATHVGKLDYAKFKHELQLQTALLRAITELKKGRR
jgi:F-type H+-transporting ATPase subunit epsilon